MSSFIMESSPILHEAQLVKADPSKAIFRMTLQTVDEVNQNRRLYPRQVLMEGMEQCRDRLSRRAFFGELDHPFPQGNDSFDSVRQTTVSLSEVSHLLRDYDISGNRLIGELETVSTPKGAILLGLLRDKAGIGMSMRGLGELVKSSGHDEVRGPLTIISFDAVSMPSHKSAVVDFNEMRFESKMILERAGMICCGDKCFLPEYFDKLVETKIIKFFGRWV